MNPSPKPPPGVMPLLLWVEKNPSPTVGDRLRRYIEVNEAIARARAANWEPLLVWLVEVLGTFPGDRPA